ncbi:lysophospholipase [Virgibacillus profundi]|uniref:Lysophospholipase n=1 Tax=Virgibacillus profundi TaxID=2024555 RepID=A0A2A2IB57_9BACI|nr:alpha/beta hydrolase [Virgibacillus profundi]PAV28618.1 lysophospholipase [Virgibacillus profundi]PXY52786.1 lysophospholipase [Virgibacillus profundi]
MEKTFWMKMDDDVEIYVKKWFTSVEKPKAIVQLSHGMVEHINRYKEFAEHLLEKDIFVYGNDHRGHGNTGEKQGLLGYFAAEDGFTKTTEDLYAITKQIKLDHPHTPIFLMGHSMGSFMVRNYLQEYSGAIDGAILSGTGYFPKLKSLAGKKLAEILPPRKESKLMNSLAFGTYNKKIKQKNTGFDWLSGDEKAVQIYIDDPHTGFIPTSRFFYDLMSGLITMNNQKLNHSIRNDLPLLIISGDADPVGNYSKGIWKTANLYEKIGLENITTMLFTDGRHELLNELNKDEVYTAIYRWMENNF